MAKGASQLNRSAMHLLHRAGQCAADIFALEARASGLTPRQFAVLMVVAEEEGLTQTDLVERTGIDRSTLAEAGLDKKILIRAQKWAAAPAAASSIPRESV